MKEIEIKDIAMWEETDSELAKYNIQQLTNDNKELLKTYDDLEEQYKSLMKQIIEQDKRIDKAIEYIYKFEDIKAYYSYEENGYEEYNYDEDFKKELSDILRGEDNEK